MKLLFTDQITNISKAQDYLTNLYNEDLLYHPEDDPRDIYYKNPNGDVTDLFTEEECILLDQRMTEVYKYLKDPCGFILDNLYNNQNQ